MATIEYNEIGKGVNVDGTLLQNYYGEDFNPTNPSFPSTWESMIAEDETSNFNLNNFQPGHEVGCSVVVIDNSGGSSVRLWGDFQRYDGSRHFGWDIYWDIDDQERGLYMYFGIDKDEIRPGYSKYRIHYYTVDGTIDFYSPEFTVSNLSIDSTLHPAGYLWVDGARLCYTDNTGDEIGQNGYGYKHKIAYDSGFSESVGSSNKGYIWLDTNNSLRIYYVDEYGNKRRTYASNDRYGGDVRVGSSNKGYMWVGVDRAEDGYGHLCFIAPNGSKRRILNGPPAGYE